MKAILGSPVFQYILSKAFSLALLLKLPVHTLMSRFLRAPYQRVAHYRPQPEEASLNILPLLRSGELYRELRPNGENPVFEGYRGEGSSPPSIAAVDRAIERAGGNPYISQVCLDMEALCDKGSLISANAEIDEGRSFAPIYRKIRTVLDRTVRKAQEQGVEVFLDAGPSWTLEALERLSIEMMGRYNRDKAVFHYGLRVDRRDARDRVDRVLRAAQREGFIPGIKLVPGSDRSREAERARMMGYSTPLYTSPGEITKQAVRFAENILHHPIRPVLTLDTRLESCCKRLLKRSGSSGPFTSFPYQPRFHHQYGGNRILSAEMEAKGYAVGWFMNSGKCRSGFPKGIA